MARIIYKMGAMTDAQIATIYALGRKMHVSPYLWQNTPSVARDSFNWAFEGNILRIIRYVRAVKRMMRS